MINIIAVMIVQITSYMDFLKGLGLSSICYATVNRWLKLLGYKYDEHKKSNYTDGYEKADVMIVTIDF